ncbi:MAG: rhamnulokinase, partial [Planctomycetes bacterium]|nr:rhamnulokinase [Planctomycetota bacterium]
MTSHKNYIAIDLGAESIRIILGRLDRHNLLLKEICRFPNEPYSQDGTLRWNIEQIIDRIKAGIAQAVNTAQETITSIAVDSWGVDFGVLDENGHLLENPYHYRDERTRGIMEKAFAIMPKKQIYQNTGLQFMEINTLFQLLILKNDQPHIFAKTNKLLFIADLISYLLGARIYAEYTLAGTSQMLDMTRGQWSAPIFQTFDFPLDIVPEIIQPGAVVGSISDPICRQLDINPIKIVATASHDTACAVAAVPASADNWAYISCGTWSLVGLEIKQAMINDESLNYGFTNEGGVCGAIRYLKNLIGLWPLQQCKKNWKNQGHEISYDSLTELAQNATPFIARLDLNHEPFFSPGDMPQKINDYLIQNDHQPITDKGQMVRIILESLAWEYHLTIAALERIHQKTINVIHMVGGGTKNQLLCQLTADATGKQVLAGPVEAAAMGNILIQALTDRQISSPSQARQ